MGVFEMVVAIVFIVAVAGIIKNRHSSKTSGLDAGERALLDKQAEAIARLETRVQTLERLATDRSRALAEEIDALHR